MGNLATPETAQLAKDNPTDVVSMGVRQQMHPGWRWLVFAIAVALSAFQLYTGFFGTLPSHQQRTFHLALALGLAFLLYPRKQADSMRDIWAGWVLTLAGLGAMAHLLVTDQVRFTTVLPAAVVLLAFQGTRYTRAHIGGIPLGDVVLSVMAFGAGLYPFLFSHEIILRAALPNELDLAVAAAGVPLILIAAQRVVGTPIVVVAGTMLAYAYFGQQMPGFFIHRGFGIERILGHSFLTTEGVYGTPIAISSTFIYLFVLFAAVLRRSGMERFFTDLAMSAAGWMVGGTAKVGVLTSAFSGTITGSSVANTVSNGAFTIPMMVRSGYRPAFAGAVEAASSTGGQLAPPIMGAAAFLMMEFIGVPYVEIVKAAIIPAFLFFAAQFIIIHYESKRLNIMGVPRDQLPSLIPLLLKQGYLLIPVAIIFIMLASGWSAIRAAMFGIIASVALNFLVQLIAWMAGRYHELRDRMTLVTIFEVLEDAARIALPIILACASAGLIVGSITLTGLGLKLGTGLVELSQGILPFTLFLTMVACLILGMGVPTTANYVITATLAGPALLALDVPVIAAHMFVFYLGIMADVTPPVALASYAASGIARSNPMETSFQAFKIALGGFLIPYMFVFSPQLVLHEATLATTIPSLITTLLGVYCIGMAVAGFIQSHLSLTERLLLIVAGLSLVFGEYLTDALGVVIFVAVYIYQLRYKQADPQVTLKS